MTPKMFIERDWAIFSLAENSKKPLKGSQGFKEATTSINGQDFSKGNIGIATGSRSGILVLDVDIKKEGGKNGFDSLRELVAELGELPHTFSVTTPSGGRHFYFNHPGAVGNSASQLGWALDIRADGGYVVAPGSSIDGNLYKVDNPNRPIAGNAPQKQWQE